jgi:hypothetical protein
MLWYCFLCAGLPLQHTAEGEKPLTRRTLALLHKRLMNALLRVAQVVIALSLCLLGSAVGTVTPQMS